MRTAEETVSWCIFLQREDFSTTFTDSSSCSILSKASLLSSRRVLVELQLLHDELPAAQNLLCKLAEGTLNVPSANLHK